MLLYHGTTDKWISCPLLLPPSQTHNSNERRSRNLDLVFLTELELLAGKYACRAAQKQGGRPVIFVFETTALYERKNQYVKPFVDMHELQRVIRLEG
jgi:hypothetical protein